MSDTMLIMFRGPGASLQDAGNALATHGFDVETSDESICVLMGGGPEFHIVKSNESHVRLESAEIGEGTDWEEHLKHCDCRFEIFIDDLDEVLDEINSLIEIQVYLQELTEGFIFPCWNGNLTPPDTLTGAG